MQINYLFYFTFIAGMTLWQFHSIYWVYSAVKTRFYLGRNLGSLTDEETLKSYGKIRTHMKQLIEGADAKGLFATVYSFYVITVVLFLSSSLFVFFITGWRSAPVWGMFFAILPYCFMHVRLHEKRVERSKEGDIIVQELLNNYLIHDCNMQEAIEITSRTMEDAPLGRQLYLQLAKGLQHAVTNREIENLLSTFRYAFDTAWGNVLASNIYFAHLYGIKVDAALNDLAICMTESRKSVEFGRRENHEAKIMLLFLAPVSYILSIFFACHYFNFTLAKFFFYQFGTKLGLQWFLSMVVCYVISLMIQSFLTKEKMDI